MRKLTFLFIQAISFEILFFGGLRKLTFEFLFLGQRQFLKKNTVRVPTREAEKENSKIGRERERERAEIIVGRIAWHSASSRQHLHESYAQCRSQRFNLPARNKRGSLGRLIMLIACRGAGLGGSHARLHARVATAQSTRL